MVDTGNNQKLRFVHACKRHIGRADLQRNHPVYERHEPTHDCPEDHDQAVFRDELIKELRPHDLQARFNQLSRIIRAITPPTIRFVIANSKYSVPISL